MERNQAEMTVKDATAEKVSIAFSGHLDVDSVTKFWCGCMEFLSQKQPRTFLINVQDLTYCDSAGVSLFLQIKQKQEEAGREFVIDGLSSRYKELMSAITESSNEQSACEPHHERAAIIVGKYAIAVIDNIKENVIFLGMVSHYLIYSFMHPRTIRWKDFWYTIETVGPNALPIVVLIGFLVGVISAFQSALPLGRFGAQIYIVNLVGLGLVKEMGPLMTAVLLAGRTASSFAAELGTMKINQEVDALTTMGLDPVRFLTVPRIIATTLMTPLLNIFLIFFGLFGASLVMHHLGFNFQIYLHQLDSAVKLKDFVGGMAKAVAFGVVIAAVGCLHGLKTRYGSSAVGNSTTQAVVTSLVMIVIVDGIFASIYYVLGI